MKWKAKAKECFWELNVSREPLKVQMGRNGVSMQNGFAAKVNRIKIRLDDHPEIDRAIHNEKTAMWSFGWLRNALRTTLWRSYYISWHHMAVRQEYNIWKSSQAMRNIKEGILSVWWHCEYLYVRNHFESRAVCVNQYTGRLALLLHWMDFLNTSQLLFLVALSSGHSLSLICRCW